MLKFKKFLLASFGIFLLILVVGLFVISWALLSIPVKETRAFGVTYIDWISDKYGMDKREVFLAILDDLKVKRIRLPIYWNKTEAIDDSYDFKEIDWQLEEAEKRGAEVILAIGRKLPRWPECHQPGWILDKKDEGYEKKELLEFSEVVVKKYREHPALYAWQVENEPFLPFGENCQLLGGEFLDKEISLVRKIDPEHPIIITDSGELSFWVKAVKRADIFGTTIYRTVWNENLGYFTYPLPPAFFRVKRALIEFFVGNKPMLVSELQAEPWGPYENYEYELFTIEEQLSHFNIETFREHIEYAKRTGFDEFYLWGVEWWYWLKINGHPEIWNEAKKLF
ncbi:hypothetical protein A2757_02705 [Candidatus Giovannonibacteria bacterium RIFCSPHIGHO2_01_FULL_48_47]|nr:MAG: hypothetical protein A2757_02705 [Candidatus Giovannonibacteria bacterium RIFCSPHIGHO2_01_FULL_48_47]OGF69052.1 MAG: hypothetical protein A3D61_03380 [Candidatus Giovannonibacteria bacterium RIFCSPHIGHO2_02_FULL_48_15]OGF87970.1 MAG: hypothetical protein A3B26_03705 [Candidatus Giovannonibacteria bacterium RIFCSPLOWO2_01_FULL_48_47]OGF95108.1 MAG: hypothetical protein A2433_03110 [Candidatus Giovannonibacteria bacterium RIFOXYC1_FULL_48_8]OGF95820.1 MAG: hypothetical protein A2613_03285